MHKRDKQVVLFCTVIAKNEQNPGDIVPLNRTVDLFRSDMLYIFNMV